MIYKRVVSVPIPESATHGDRLHFGVGGAYAELENGDWLLRFEAAPNPFIIDDEYPRPVIKVGAESITFEAFEAFAISIDTDSAASSKGERNTKLTFDQNFTITMGLYKVGD